MSLRMTLPTTTLTNGHKKAETHRRHQSRRRERARQSPAGGFDYPVQLIGTTPSGNITVYFDPSLGQQGQDLVAKVKFADFAARRHAEPAGEELGVAAPWASQPAASEEGRPEGQAALGGWAIIPDYVWHQRVRALSAMFGSCSCSPTGSITPSSMLGGPGFRNFWQPDDDFFAEQDFVDVTHVQHVDDPAKIRTALDPPSKAGVDDQQMFDVWGSVRELSQFAKRGIEFLQFHPVEQGFIHAVSHTASERRCVVVLLNLPDSDGIDRARKGTIDASGQRAERLPVSGNRREFLRIKITRELANVRMDQHVDDAR